MIFLNWKANGSKVLAEEFKKLELGNNFVIMPPHHLLCANFGNAQIGGQTVSQFGEGAYTGEITAKMLGEAGAKFCLVGHSERRKYQSENNDLISKQILQLVNYNIVPVLCVGENLEERKNGKYFEVLKNQLSVFKNECIVAYEPVWSIGTGIIPTIEEIKEVKDFIKNLYANVKVLYGGSVTSLNIADILTTGVDGVLIGSASLKIDEVLKISKIVSK